MRSVSVLCALLAACSAPSPDEAPNRGPTPSPAELEREAEARQAVSSGAAEPTATPTPAPSAAEGKDRASGAVAASVAPPGAALVEGAPEAAERVAASRPPTAPDSWDPPPVAATPRAQLPPLPFTAYTTAPLTAGGVDLQRIGVRVEVTAIEGDTAQVSCSACPAPATGEEAEVPLSRLRAGRAPGGTGDALDTMLMLRARWASGASLPPEATNVEMCALADHGFVLGPEGATWSHAGGAAVLRWSGQAWDLDTGPTRPTAASRWTCRARGEPPSPTPRSSEAP